MKCKETAFSFLGKKIRDERKRAKLTQAALSDGIVTRNMLSRIENGDAVPSLTTLVLLADRLNVSVAYLLDDSDDGTELRNHRLLAMARKEYIEGNYEGCLNFAACLTTHNEERERLTAYAEYSLAMDKLDQGSLYQAQVHLVAALKLERCLTRPMIAEGRLYRALIDGFMFSPQSGREEGVFLDILKFATAPNDFTVFVGILMLLRSGKKDAAAEMIKTAVFSAPFYRSLLSALISWEENDLKQVKKYLIEATGFPMISPIRAYCLTLLERVSVLLGDFENAYAYMNSRRELLEVLLQR